MPFVSFLLGAALLGTPQPDAQPLVHNIEVTGNRRIAAETVLRRISCRLNEPFAPERAAEDIRRLHSLGLFRSLEIEKRAARDGGVDLIYRVSENPWLRSFAIAAASPSLEDRIHGYLKAVKLEPRPAEPFDSFLARRIEVSVREMLRQESYPQGEVRMESRESDGTVDVELHVATGPRLQIGEVIFEGNDTIDTAELRGQLEHSRPRSFWEFGSPAGRYQPELLTLDMERLRRHYQSRGFASVEIGTPEVFARQGGRNGWSPSGHSEHEDPQICIRIRVAEGPRFRLESVQLEGDTKAAAVEVREILASIETPSWYDRSLLESKRDQIARALGRRGYGLAGIELRHAIDYSAGTIRSTYFVDAGYPLQVGRIRFAGHGRLHDSLLRRCLRLQEGRIFDVQALDESIQNLNRSGLISELKRSDVDLQASPDENIVDITFNVREKDRHGMFMTGGSGGIGGSYLGVLYQAINLLGLGELLTMELDGGAAQSNWLLNMAGNHFLGAPFGIALSVFHRLTDYNVASVVPDAGDVVNLMRRKSTGFQLGGSYSVTRRATAGLTFAHERGSVETAGTDTPYALTTLSPAISLDLAPGTSLALSRSWTGDWLFRTLFSTGESFRLQSRFRDPWTSGRNSFSFRLHGTALRSRGASTLPLGQRLFPGDEVVRGFGRGGMSVWGHDSSSGSASVTPLGADGLLGLSSEYRVPLRGRLSGTAFFDLGWSRLSQNAARASDPLAESNGILRGSLGGELRLQLPLLDQPARMIFAWNPLRLGAAIVGDSGSLVLKDPSHAIRFALGGIY